MAAVVRYRMPIARPVMRSCCMSPDNSRATVGEHSPPAVGPRHRIPPWRTSDAAALLPTLVVLGVTATMVFSGTRGAGLGMFTFEQVRFLAMVETSSQRLAHRVGSQVHLSYGLIHSIALQAFERVWGFLDFGRHFRQVGEIGRLCSRVILRDAPGDRTIGI